MFTSERPYWGRRNPVLNRVYMFSMCVLHYFTRFIVCCRVSSGNAKMLRLMFCLMCWHDVKHQSNKLHGVTLQETICLIFISTLVTTSILMRILSCLDNHSTNTALHRSKQYLYFVNYSPNGNIYILKGDYKPYTRNINLVNFTSIFYVTVRCRIIELGTHI